MLSSTAGSRPRSAAASVGAVAGAVAWAPFPLPLPCSLPISSRSMSMLIIPSSPPLVHITQVPDAERRLLERLDGQLEGDRAEALRLPRTHDAEADQLEQCEEDHDHLAPVRLRSEQARELDPLREREAREDAGHGLVDRDRFALDLVRPWRP